MKGRQFPVFHFEGVLSFSPLNMKGKSGVSIFVCDGRGSDSGGFFFHDPGGSGVRNKEITW